MKLLFISTSGFINLMLASIRKHFSQFISSGLALGLLILFVLTSNCLVGQVYSGKVIDEESDFPIEFVNIGIVGKNIGTTSDIKGNFDINIESSFNNDSLLFSCIGYLPHSISINEYKELNNWNIKLHKKSYNLNEIVITPKSFKRKILGITSESNLMQAGFTDNILGYECGLLLKVKKSALLEKVDINIATCTYDSIFYRLNIYRVTDENNFENILQKPIYISLQKDEVEDKISIDLSSKNIIVEGDFLVTLEHVKDLGSGFLYFSAGVSKKTYFRKTSQGAWDTAPVGISISVTAMVEK